MQKIYCRSIRPDGYGEGVVPEMEEPKCWNPDKTLCYYCREFMDHLASLPVLYLIHPDLAKVGFIGEHRERYEAMDYWTTGMWQSISKDTYDIVPIEERRIVLVPVEGKETTQWPELGKALKGLSSAIESAQSKPEEEKEVVKYEYDSMGEYLECYGDFVLRCGWNGPVTFMLKNPPPNPTPVTGEAGLNELMKDIEALVYYSQIHTVKGVIPAGMPTHEEAWKRAQQFLWNHCKHNGNQYVLQAASRTSDAVEKEVDRYAHLKKRMREYFDNVTPEELVAKFEAMGYTFVELSKPNPVTGEWLKGRIKDVIDGELKRSLEAGTQPDLSMLEGIEIGMNKMYEIQAASRTSDAVEVLEWLLDVNLNGVGGNQFHKIIMIDGDFYWETDNDGDQPLDGKDLYKIFKQQTTKP